MKINSEMIITMDAVDVYKLVLSKEISRFPTGFWMIPEAYDNAVKCIRYLVEEVLKLNIEDIPKRVSKKTFLTNKLGGMITTLFNNSPIDAIELSYPGRFKPWEFSQVSNGYWDSDDNVKDALEWLMSKISENDVVDKWNQDFIYSNDLRGMLEVRFDSSPYKALDYIRPGRFKPWELKMNVPNNYWDLDSNVRDALEWLIKKETLNGNLNVVDIWCLDIFKKNGLKGLVDIKFNSSPFKALDYVRPGEFKPWELNQVPKGYWDIDSNVNEALEWLILKIESSGSRILEVWSQNIFNQNGLMGMLHLKFNSSPFKALDYIRPNEFQPWELNVASRRYWENEENWIEALEKVVKSCREKDAQIKEITLDILTEYNLVSFLNEKFKGNITNLNTFAKKHQLI